MVRVGQANIQVFDLRQITEGLGHHLDEIGSYTGTCEQCSEFVGQDVDECTCGTPVMWKYSRRWDAIFLYPDDALAQRLLRLCRLDRFKDGKEYFRWKVIRDSLDRKTVERTVARCKDVLTNKRKMKPYGVRFGRALMKYSLNSLAIESEKEDDELEVRSW